MIFGSFSLPSTWRTSGIADNYIEDIHGLVVHRTSSGTESINTQNEYTYLCGKTCLTLLIYVEIKAVLTKINLNKY